MKTLTTTLATALLLALTACQESPPPLTAPDFALDQRDLTQFWGPHTDRLAGSTDDDVIGYAAAQASGLGLERADFAVSSRATDELGLEHVRLQQQINGVPVLGGDILVHLRGDTVFATGGTLVDHLDVDTVAALDRDLARAALLAHLVTGPFLFDTGERAPANLAEPRLVVVRTADGDKLAWHSSTLIDDLEFPAQIEALVDAHTGAVLQAADVLETAKGGGGGGGPPGGGGGTVTTREAAVGTGTTLYSGVVSLDTTRVTVDGAVTGYELQDQTRENSRVTDMKNRQTGGSLFTDVDNGWGDGTAGSAQSAAADAHYGATTTYRYFADTHARNGIANDNRGVLSRVHYGRNYNNAFWSDSCFCMTYGDGDGSTFKSLVSLDVAGHEMTHGVTSRTANLVYSGESGGLNEATSDIFGAMVEQFAANENDPFDWLVGEEFDQRDRDPGQEGIQGYLRNMADPTSDGGSIDHYSNYVDGLNVHRSSGIANNFFYLLAVGGTNRTSSLVVATGIGTTDAAAIWYYALENLMTSATNFAGARAATLTAADVLFGAESAQHAAAANAWTAVGVN